MIISAVHLNFLPFCEQEGSFIIYRQKYNGQERQEGFYRYKLPEAAGSENYEDTWLTLSPSAGFEEFICNTNDNVRLTVKMIGIALEQHLEKARLDPGKEYLWIEQRFNRKLAFILAEYKEGYQIVQLEPYYLNVSSKYGVLVHFGFSRKKGEHSFKDIQRHSLSLDRNYQSNRNYYSDKYDKVWEFINRFKSRLFPLQVGETPFDIVTSFERLEPRSLVKRAYIFGGGASDFSQFNGIKDNGPFASVQSDPVLIFIFPDDLKRYANEVYSAIVGQSYPQVFPGISRFFRVGLEKDQVLRISIKSYGKEDMENLGSQLDAILDQNQDRLVIGVFIELTRPPLNAVGFSPYYHTKYLFARRQLTLQAVTIDKIKGKDGLKWSASNIALQMFSKLGGIPWIVKSDNEGRLVFGIGSAHSVEPDGRTSRFLAYCICLNSSGIYKCLDVLGESDSENSYLKQFRQNIIAAISNQIDQSVKTVVVHLPFKIRNVEMEELKEGINALRAEHEKVDFVCIKINTRNKFFGFAENNSKVPYEGSYVKLSRTEYLLWIEGLRQGNENVLKRIGNPLHVKFIYNCPQDEEIKRSHLQDIYNLAGANWRGFNARLSPISIFYPQLVARYISGFQRLNSIATVAGYISKIKSPWFL